MGGAAAWTGDRESSPVRLRLAERLGELESKLMASSGGGGAAGGAVEGGGGGSARPLSTAENEVQVWYSAPGWSWVGPPRIPSYTGPLERIEKSRRNCGDACTLTAHVIPHSLEVQVVLCRSSHRLAAYFGVL